MSLASLVFSYLVEHSFSTDLDTDFDSMMGSFALVGEQTMVADREALEVRVVDDICEATPNMRWSRTNAREGLLLLRQLVYDSFPSSIVFAGFP